MKANALVLSHAVRQVGALSMHHRPYSDINTRNHIPCVGDEKVKPSYTVAPTRYPVGGHDCPGWRCAAHQGNCSGVSAARDHVPHGCRSERREGLGQGAAVWSSFCVCWRRNSVLAVHVDGKACRLSFPGWLYTTLPEASAP